MKDSRNIPHLFADQDKSGTIRAAAAGGAHCAGDYALQSGLLESAAAAAAATTEMEERRTWPLTKHVPPRTTEREGGREGERGEGQVREGEGAD